MDDVTQIIDPPPSRNRLLLDGLLAMRKPRLEGAPTLPRERLVRSAVELSAHAIAAYGRACGFRREQGVPLSYPHVLAFPLHLMLLTRPSFPYPASGMVHLANRIRQHRRLQEGQALRLEVFAERWVAHAKGQALSIATHAYSAGELVWQSESLYLRRDVANPVGEPWGDSLALPEEGVRRTQRWVLPADLGRRFAKVSGGFQPDPYLVDRRAAVRFSPGHRPWHVDPGPRPGRPATPRRAGRGRGPLRFQVADLPARPGRPVECPGRRPAPCIRGAQSGRGQTPHAWPVYLDLAF